MTRAECQRCRELMDDWLNSELSIETTREVLAHVERCDECGRELERRRMVRQLLRRRLDAPLPSQLDTRILNAIAAVDRPAPKPPPHDRWPSSSSRLSLPWWRSSAFALVVGVLVVAIAWWQIRGVPVSAAELLTRSAVAERSVLLQPALVVHRSLTFEERSVPSGALVNRRRIELWRNGRTGVTARRAFDDRGRLTAAEWLHDSGAATIYQPGLPAVEGAAAHGGVEDRARKLVASRELWRMDLSSEQFLALTESRDSVELTRTPATYEVTYASRTPSPDGVSKATLTLRREDLRPVRETLVIGAGAGAREYRFTEHLYELPPSERVAPAVFEPDAELVVLPSTPLTSTRFALPAGRSAHVEVWASAVDPALEVEALYALHRVGADLRERPRVAAVDGTLTIRARVASEDRRAELMAALDPVLASSPVEIDVVVDPVSSDPAPEGAVSGSFAASDAVRRYFEDYLARRVAPDRRTAPETAAAVEDAVARLRGRVLERAANAKRHVAALVELLDRFGSLQPEGLSLNATAMWQTMIRDHARAVKHETETLRLELQPIFFATAAAPEPTPSTDPQDAVTLTRAIRELARLTAANSNAIEEAFAAGNRADAALVVDREAFWRALLNVERLASQFEGPLGLGK